MPQAVIGALRVVLSADTAVFDRNLSAADKKLAAFSRNVTRVAAGMAIAVGVALTALTRSSLETIDAQAKLAQQTGATVAAIQTLDHAGNLAGVSMDEMANNLSQLNRRLGEAATYGTGTAKRAFDALGIQVEEFIGLDADERVARIADAIRGLGSEAQQAAIAYDLFGRAGTTMLPLLQAGGQAIRDTRVELERFGVAVTDAQAAQIEAANDAVTRLGLAFTGLGNTLAVKVAPKLEEMATRLGDWIANNDHFIDDVLRLAEVLGGALAGVALAKVISGAITAAKVIGDLAIALRAGALTAGTFTAALGPIGLIIGAISAAVLIFGGRQEQAATAADTHRQALEELHGRINDGINLGPQAVATLKADAEAQLVDAEAALQNAMAQWEAATAIEAATLAAAGAAVIPQRDPRESDQIMSLVDTIRALREEIGRLDAAAGGGTGQGGLIPPLIDPEQAARDLAGLDRELASARDLIEQHYQDQLQIIGNAARAHLIGAEEASARMERIARDRDKALAEINASGIKAIEEQDAAGYAAAEDAAEENARRMKEIADQLAAELLAARQQAVTAWAGVLGDLADLIKDKGEKAFRIAKALSIAEALINVAQGITKALAGPFPFINAAAIAAAGAIQIAKIRQQEPNGSGSVTPPSAGPSQSAGLNQTLTVHGATADQIFNGADMRGLAERLLQYQRDGGTVVFA